MIAQECFFDRIQKLSQLTGTMIDAHFFAKIQPTVLPSLEREIQIANQSLRVVTAQLNISSCVSKNKLSDCSTG